MKSNAFVDTNLWIYAFIKSEKDANKHKIMVSFLENLNETCNIVISIQIINEFHWVMKKKYKIDEKQIRKKINDGIIKVSNVSSINLNTYKKSCDIRDKYSITFWDSLIIASAIENNCNILYSEDMKEDLNIENKVKIRNPFT